MEYQFLSSAWMCEPESPRVQKISIQRTVLFDESFVIFFAVNIITHNGMTNRAQVNAYLMSAPRLDFHFQQREFSKRFDDLIFRVSRSSATLKAAIRVRILGCRAIEVSIVPLDRASFP